MTNPWLAIPLADYEGHLASPAVGQAEMVANEFEALLKSHAPQTVALVGCAGGNGFDKAAEVGVTRLVGIDINARYIADAKDRCHHPARALLWHNGYLGRGAGRSDDLARLHRSQFPFDSHRRVAG